MLSEKTPAVEEKVDKALERCFATKARNEQRLKVAATASATRAKAAPRRAARAS